MNIPSYSTTFMQQIMIKILVDTAVLAERRIEQMIKHLPGRPTYYNIAPRRQTALTAVCLCTAGGYRAHNYVPDLSGCPDPSLRELSTDRVRLISGRTSAFFWGLILFSIVFYLWQASFCFSLCFSLCLSSLHVYIIYHHRINSRKYH